MIQYTFHWRPSLTLAQPHHSSGRPATLIIVDDQSLLRSSLRERLAKDGHIVLEAGTAAEALDQTANGVDLVLLDFTLADGDGLTCA